MSAVEKFQVGFKVRPGSAHPSHWEFIWGVLGIVLTAQNESEAEERASTLVAQLPFEVVGGCCAPVPWTGPRNEHEAISEEMLTALGFAYWIIRVPLEEFGEAQPEDMEWGCKK